MKVADIRIDGGTQPRAAINEDAVRDYAERLQHGVEFPPVVVFHDGRDHWLADGFHRWHAHQASGMGDIRAEIRNGTRRDAVLYAVGSNAAHGLRRTNADKRCAVTILLRDSEWSEWSDAEIARRCGVSHPTVASVRRELSPENFTGDAPSGDKKVTYTTKHGTKATMNFGNRPCVSEKNEFAEHPDETVLRKAMPTPDAGLSEADHIDEMSQEIAILRRELDAASKDNAAMGEAFDADDRLAVLHRQNKELREVNRVLQSRLDGEINKNAELVREVTKAQRKIERMERASVNIP